MRRWLHAYFQGVHVHALYWLHFHKKRGWYK